MPTAAELDAKYFPGFGQRRVTANGVEIHSVIGGAGPPLLLLHGAPQSHFMWHRVAGELAKRFTVVAPDLRGYGESGKPPSPQPGAPSVIAAPQAPAQNAAHAFSSKRAMAQDQVELMAALGFDRFSVAGHDRGGRVVHRLTRDHPGRVVKAAVLDILPTLWLYEHTDMNFARAYWHWFFYIQPPPMPEDSIRASAERTMAGLSAMLKMPADMAALHADYLKGDVAHGMCEDYRAGASIDLEHDRADLSRKIECPLLVLFGANGPMGRLYDTPGVWREHASSVSARGVPCGHFIPEEAPQQTLDAFLQFFQ